MEITFATTKNNQKFTFFKQAYKGIVKSWSLYWLGFVLLVKFGN